MSVSTQASRFPGTEIHERRPNYPIARVAGNAQRRNVVENHVEPEPTLESRVLQTLTGSGHAQLRQIEVAIAGATVSLAGRVPTYYLKQLAQSLVLSIEGVESLCNELQVS
ncbi:MAG TPA: BON domain-containing protein [Planctomycetaceae bacterium]|nr:BON domain-containing protein [Planctomycetaceae bacterium]